jgi:hypothetical protein
MSVAFIHKTHIILRGNKNPFKGMEMNFTIYSQKQVSGKTGLTCKDNSADGSSGLKPGFLVYPPARAEARAWESCCHRPTQGPDPDRRSLYQNLRLT